MMKLRDRISLASMLIGTYAAFCLAIALGIVICDDGPAMDGFWSAVWSLAVACFIGLPVCFVGVAIVLLLFGKMVESNARYPECRPDGSADPPERHHGGCHHC